MYYEHKKHDGSLPLIGVAGWIHAPPGTCFIAKGLLA
jgi:hypothetical protein